MASIAFAGATVTLVPQTSAPYAPDSIVKVDVMLQQTPAGSDIQLRHVQLDFTASDAAAGQLQLIGPITHSGSNVRFWNFTEAGGNCTAGTEATCGAGHFLDSQFTLPTGREKVVSMTYYFTDPNVLTVNPSAQRMLPASASIKIGEIDVRMPNNATPACYTLDALTATQTNPNLGGAEIRFGFGTDVGGIPLTTWRVGNPAATGIAGDSIEMGVNQTCGGPPTPEPFGMQMARFISFVVPGSSAGSDTGLRVELTSLHHPPSPPGGTPDFSVQEGTYRYVNSFGGSTTCVDSATLATHYRCGQLGCQPEYRDWAAELSGATNPASPAGLIYVIGEAVVPSSTLNVSHIAASCGAAPFANTCASASTMLAISTARWGDVGAGGGGPPDGSANVIDIALVVDNVKGLVTAPPEWRAWMKNPTVSDTDPVNVIDIGLTVDAVKNLPYPYSIAECQ